MLPRGPGLWLLVPRGAEQSRLFQGGLSTTSSPLPGGKGNDRGPQRYSPVVSDVAGERGKRIWGPGHENHIDLLEFGSEPPLTRRFPPCWESRAVPRMAAYQHLHPRSQKVGEGQIMPQVVEGRYPR